MVDANCGFLPQLPMAPEVLDDLWVAKELAGYQKGKERAVFQGTTLNKFCEADDAKGTFLRSQRSWAHGPGGTVERQFLNLNKGDKPFIDDDGTVATLGKHKDSFFSDAADGRAIGYYMSGGATASLDLFLDDEMMVLTVPRGAMLYCKREFLENVWHAHGANGRSISLVSEVANPSLFASTVPPTSSTIEAAGAAQQPLALAQTMANWAHPETLFLGSKLDFVAGKPGSKRSMALTLLIDQPKERGKRRKNVKQAREQLALMTPDDIDAAASQRGHDLSMLGMMRGTDEDGVVRDLGIDATTGKSVAQAQRRTKDGNTISRELPQHLDYLTQLRRDDPGFNSYAALMKKRGIPKAYAVAIKNFFTSARRTQGAIAKTNEKARAKKAPSKKAPAMRDDLR